MRGILFLIFSITLLTACGDKVDIDGVKVDYDELLEMQVSQQNKLDEMNEELESTEKKLRSNKEKIEELELLEMRRDDYKKEVDNKKKELKGLEENISKKKDELKNLKGDILELSDKPIDIDAGYFYFGTDIEPGRYTVKPKGNNSGNFFVRGTNRVNIILGNDYDSHVEEFTFEAYDGDELETKIPVELYLVE